MKTEFSQLLFQCIDEDDQEIFAVEQLVESVHFHAKSTEFFVVLYRTTNTPFSLHCNCHLAACANINHHQYHHRHHHHIECCLLFFLLLLLLITDVVVLHYTSNIATGCCCGGGPAALPFSSTDVSYPS